MRYVTLAEAVTIAEAVTGIDAATLARVSRLELLDSALHAPEAGFGEVEFYPAFIDKAAVLVVRIARNHPLVDGNKRLAWATLNMFLTLNGHGLRVTADDAVATMQAVAAGDLDERPSARGSSSEWTRPEATPEQSQRHDSGVFRKRRTAMIVQIASTMPNGHAPLRKPYALDKAQPTAKAATYLR